MRPHAIPPHSVVVIAAVCNPDGLASASECAARYGRRPVIAVLDTGVRAHPWLGVTRSLGGYGFAADSCVKDDPAIQKAIYEHAAAAAGAGDLARRLIEHPWDTPVTSDPLIGELDTAVGHGTFISGIVGQFFRQFALTIAISAIISTINSLTLSPALAALLLKPKHVRKDPLTWLLEFLFGWFVRLFDRGFLLSE